MIGEAILYIVIIPFVLGGIVGYLFKGPSNLNLFFNISSKLFFWILLLSVFVFVNYFSIGWSFFDDLILLFGISAFFVSYIIILISIIAVIIGLAIGDYFEKSKK